MATAIDIVILSYAKNDGLRAVTEACVESLINSEDPAVVKFNILILESEPSLKPYQYKNTKTVYPAEPFNFNKYLNIGVASTSSEYICFCNNDLIFHPNWASELLKRFNANANLLSASPMCPQFHPNIGFTFNTGNYEGYEIRKQIAGWCFMVKRSIFKTIGLFDEKFKFWFADADYAMLLKKFKLKHELVTSSLVTHLDGRSTAELDEKAVKAMTSEQYWYFQYKWEHHNWMLYKYRSLRSYLRKIK